MVVTSALIAVLPVRAQAATSTAPCPHARGVLAQECALASALVVSLVAPGLDVTASGSDGAWESTSQAPGLFQSNRRGRQTVRVAHPDSEVELRAVPGNNLNVATRRGAAFVTSERFSFASDGTYRWQEVQGFVAYRLAADGTGRFAVESHVSDFWCRQGGSGLSVSRDCQTGTSQWAVADTETAVSVARGRFRITQPTTYVLELVRNNGQGSMTRVASRSVAGVWTYDGTVTWTGTRGTSSWSSGLQDEDVTYAVTSTRDARSWAAAGHRV